MSGDRDRLEEARKLWDNALDALDTLRHIDESVLQEVAKDRVRMPITVYGQSGKTWKGESTSRFAKRVKLGEAVNANANKPRSGLKSYILDYIDRVNMLKANDEPEHKAAECSSEEEEMGVCDSMLYNLANDRLLDEGARNLPPLSEQTFTEWADYIAMVIVEDASRYGDWEFEEVGGKQQGFSTGYPIEIERQIMKNYQKAYKRKLKRVSRRAAKRTADSDLCDKEEWEAYYKAKALSDTWIKDIEQPAAREKVGEILSAVISDVP